MRNMVLTKVCGIALTGPRFGTTSSNSTDRVTGDRSTKADRRPVAKRGQKNGRLPVGPGGGGADAAVRPVTLADRRAPALLLAPLLGPNSGGVLGGGVRAPRGGTGFGELRVGHWNINGFCTRTQDKLSCDGVLSWIQSMHVAAFTETHLERGEGLPIPGYRVFEANRPRNKAASRCSGGVAIAVRRCIARGVRRIPCPSSEMVWILLDGPFFGLPTDVVIGAIYEGPQQSPVAIRENREAFDEVQLQLDRLPAGAEVILLGDMNARVKQWSELIITPQSSQGPSPLVGIQAHADRVLMAPRQNQDTESNGNGTPFVNLCRRNEFVILNGRTTGDPRGMYTCFQKKGHSLVDYATASNGLLDRVTSFTVGDLRGELSDHAPIELCLRVSVGSTRPAQLAGEEGAPLHKVHWGDGAAGKLRAYFAAPEREVRLNTIRESLITSPSRGCIEEAVGEFTELLLDGTRTAAKILVVSPRVRQGKTAGGRRNKKWFDCDCERARAEVRRLGRVMQAGDSSRRPSFYAARKRYKRLLKWKLAQFKRLMLRKMQDLSGADDNRRYWDTLRQLKSQHTRITGTSIPMDEWVAHFTRLLNHASEDLSEPGQMPPSGLSTEPSVVFDPMDAVITMDEVRCQIKKNKDNKATFLDNISSETLKYAGESVVPTLTQIFNAVYSMGCYPASWRGATITPLHKKGDWDDTSNYRGIAVSSCLGKSLDAILNDRLSDFMLRSRLGHKYQTGFEKGSRTTDNVLTLSTIVDQAKAYGQKIYMCFIDLTKAYDTVCRPLLLRKLREAGAGSKFLGLLADMYRGVTYCIKVNGRVSCFFASNRGLKQGGAMSPKLFNGFMADAMIELLREKDVPLLGQVPVPALFFADDVVLMARTPEALQRLINTFHSYCEENFLIINVSKSKTLVAGRHARGRLRREVGLAPRFFVGESHIEAVQVFTYLGVDIHSVGPVPVSNDSMTLKGERAQRALVGLTREASVELALKLHRQLIEPILLYGAEIWAPYALSRSRCLTDDIMDSSTVSRVNADHLYLAYLKQVLGVKKRAINCAVMGEVGVRPLMAMAMERTARYVRAVEALGDDCCLVAQALAAQKRLHTFGKRCWYTGYARMESQLGGVDAPRGAVRRAVEDRHVRAWRERLGEASRLSFLAKVKTTYEMETYLQYRCRRVRRAFTKYRTSDHNLRVERDRWLTQRSRGVNDAAPPRHERVCLACDEGKVEDEYHVFTCPAYAEWRREYGITASSPLDIIEAVRRAASSTMWYVYRVMTRVDLRFRL